MIAGLGCTLVGNEEGKKRAAAGRTGICGCKRGLRRTGAEGGGGNGKVVTFLSVENGSWRFKFDVGNVNSRRWGVGGAITGGCVMGGTVYGSGRGRSTGGNGGRGGSGGGRGRGR